jgi:hypothetical protein
LLFGVAALAACDAVDAPDAPTGRLATEPGVAGTSTAPRPGSAAVQGSERPYGAKLVWSTYAIVTAAQSGDPLFGGRCSVPSKLVEYGNLSGEIMHAGRSAGTGNHCIQGTPLTGLTLTDGTVTFTTANGDVLTASYGGGTISLANGLFVVDTWFNLTGGTGRFEGASGAGTQHGVASATPQQVLAGAPLQLEQTGTITYAPGRGGQ